MADSLTAALDKIYDAVDRAVETTDRVLNRSKQTEERLDSRKPPKRPAVIDVKATERKPPKSPHTTATQAPQALARKPRFYITEAITPSGTLFVVTDGGNARTECSTREFAEKILQALEKAQ